GQKEAGESADHADQSTDGSDIVRVIRRDVLEDGGFAETHEEAENKRDDDKGPKPDFEMRGNPATDSSHYIIGRWQRQYERREGGDRKACVENGARADAIGEEPAIGAENTGRNGIGRADQSGGFNVEPIDADQVTRQPKGQRDEASE